MKHTARAELILSLLRDLYLFHPVRAVVTFGLMFARSITAGFGLLLILPLLQLSGLSLGAATSTKITASLQAVFEWVHLPMVLLSMLCVYTAFMIALALIAYFEQVSSAVLQKTYIKYLRQDLHQRLLKTPWVFFLNRKMSDVLYALTNQVQGVVVCNHQLLGLLHQLLLVMVYTGLACYLSLKLTLLATGSALLLLGLMRPLHRLTSKAGSLHLAKNQLMFQAISEQFSALKMIKGSGLENKFMKALTGVNDALSDESQRLALITAKSKLFYMSGAACFFSMLLYAAIAVFQMAPSELLLLLIIFSRVLPMVSSAQQMYQRILHQLPAYEAIQTLYNALTAASLEPPQSSQLPQCIDIAFNQAIEFKQVCFGYPSKPEIKIIDGLSFKLHKNTTLAFIGPSGVGKSTLADLVAGLIMPSAGEIWVDNQPLTARHSIAWRQKIAYVTQEVFLFHASIRDNLSWFQNTYSDEILWGALKQAAAHFVFELEEGLDTILGDRGVRLSGGERQRIALARALLMKPELLILDESTNALDANHLMQIQGVLKALQGKMTIVIISHQADMQRFATHTIHLSRLKADVSKQEFEHVA